MLFGLARRRLVKTAVVVATVLLLAASCGSDAGSVTDMAAEASVPVQESAGGDAVPTLPATPTDETTEAPAPAPAPTAAPAPAPTEVPEVGDELFPTVVGATASTADGTSWTFAVTLLSEYDSPERYADAWRVLDSDDNELGIRVLGHDHANEQPFTRTTSVDVPVDVATVFIEGRDQVNGWSGERFRLELER